MAEFEAAYEAKGVPILKKHGLIASSERGRATPDSVFSRLFEVKAPSEVADRQKALQGDAAWKGVLRSLGTAFGTDRPDSLIRYDFKLYAAPAGPGKAAPAGPGKKIPAGRGTGHWRTYDVTDGLPGPMVTSMLQDREGYLWLSVAGDGVSRYDGQKFVTFTTKDGLAHYVGTSILQDREGNFWFSTRGGVTRYDGQRFVSFTTKDGLAHNWVTSILQDREGRFWFGTRGGASRYDGKAWTTFTVKDGLANNTVRKVVQDREGYLWFGTSEGLSRYDGRKFITFTTQDGLAHNLVYSIVQDREGYLWFGTRGGVSRYDGQKFTTFTTQDGLANNAAVSILQDQAGYIWVGTEGGASRYEGRGFTTFTTKEGLSDNIVESVFQDRGGHLWFGSHGGVSRYDGGEITTFIARDGLGDNWVTSILQDREGNLWFSTGGGGTSRYDGREFTTFTKENGLIGNFVMPTFQDREERLWFGTHDGVSRYDGRVWTSFTTADGLAHNDVWSAIQDREGVLWFGTFGGGVSRYDGKTWTTFTTADGLANNFVISAFQDRQGHLWFGTSGGGVSRYDGQKFITFAKENGLVHNWVHSIFQDREGSFWFGTERGLSRYDGKVFTTFTKEDGLPYDWVNTIFQDRGGHLWFGTRSGLSRYDGKIFTTLTKEDGLANNVVWSIFQDRKGDIWFGTSGGLARCRLSIPLPSPMFIDAVVADRRYEKVSDVVVPSSVGLTVFEFHGISFKTRPEAMAYRYRLKGYDKDWKTTHDRRVEYQDLPRGTYTFEVQAVDRDLVYSEKPATVTLRVRMPYERIGLLSALGVAVALIAWQAGRIVQRDRRLAAANEDLRREIVERQRAEEERARLDERLQQLHYLYRLRATLSAARSPDGVCQEAGEAMMEALSPITSAGIVIQYDRRTWQFGETGREAQRRYERPLGWGGRQRGRLSLSCGVELSESQERMLLDETAGQIAAALEAREMEAQILQSARLVSLGQMAAGVAHELNQPLGAISATAEDLYLRTTNDREAPRETVKAMMQDVLGLVERMTGTVEHLRVFSRDTSKEPGFLFSMNDAVRSSLRLIEAQFRSHGIAVRVALEERLPPVLGHPHQLEQVFLNLLSNARDALDEKAEEKSRVQSPGSRVKAYDSGLRTQDSGPGGAGGQDGEEGWEKRLTIRTRREGDGPRWVVAEVEDNGTGIDEAHLGRLFEPFFTTKPADRGTGLGLSICYAIVKNHGGKIACESRKREGTTFRVMLPAMEEA